MSYIRLRVYPNRVFTYKNLKNDPPSGKSLKKNLWLEKMLPPTGKSLSKIYCPAKLYTPSGKSLKKNLWLEILCEDQEN